MRVEWLDRIRGIAIIAVVTEHLMGIVHHTEIIQVTTIFCVSVLIICMGITQSWGYKKAFANGKILKNGDFLKYLLCRMLPVLCALCVGTMAYITYNGEWIGADFLYLLTRTSHFDAAPTFYFFRHYFNLTLLSPILYWIIAAIGDIASERIRRLSSICFLIACFGIGYWSIGRFEILSQSYLFLYVIGMMYGGGGIQYPPRKKIFGCRSVSFWYWFDFIGEILLGAFGRKLQLCGRVQFFYT